jgi:hypothetical protein
MLQRVDQSRRGSDGSKWNVSAVSSAHETDAGGGAVWTEVIVTVSGSGFQSLSADGGA